METRHITIDANDIDELLIRDAADIICGGGLVAFPTETVYGLGCDATNEKAARKVYEAKGRPSDNPLIVHIADSKDLTKVSSDVNEKAKALVDKFWPGPLTIILKKRDEIPYGITGGLDTVAIRCPSHPIAHALIEECGVGIAAPSANASGRPSTTKYSHVVEDLDGRVDCIIDGGDAEIGLESTIIDLTVDVPVILRPGYISKSEIEAVIGLVLMDTAPNSTNSDNTPKAPGMKYRHYAPKAELLIVDGKEGDVVRMINRLATKELEKGRNVGIIATEQTKERYRKGSVISIGDRDNEEEIASALYDVLRQFDSMETDIIYAESPKGEKLKDAIDNRLLKAAAYRKLSAATPMQSSHVKKIIFAGGHGNCRSAMAAVLFEKFYENSDMKAISRGVSVAFEEPLNPKVEAVMVSNGLSTEGFKSKQLRNEEIESDTLIFCMEESQRQKVIKKFEKATENNTFVLSEYIGDELEIMNPYGGTLQTYGICYEVLVVAIQKLSDLILEEKTYGSEA